ncbi:TPA: class I SAM-dependent methyltransferase [Candidatus Woesearchaeota archaeon]|nr:class I SAM-dependent methyltransferase [Candidatus Woesearchaeota archaeon]
MKRSPVVTGKKAEWYAKHYYSVEDDIIPIFERMDTPFLDKRLKPGMKVLDAMCGRGRHAVRYAKRGCIVTANDLNPHMVAHARRGAKLAGAKISLMTSDATRLRGIKSGSFDAVIAMFSAVGTIPDAKTRQRAMAEFARVVKPGGIVIVHAHNRLDTLFDPGFYPECLRLNFFPKKGQLRGDMITDYNELHDMFNHFYSPAEFRKSFEKAGLKVVEEAYMDYTKRRFITGPLRKLRADGFIFVGKKE